MSWNLVLKIVWEPCSDDDFEDAIGPMETDGGMIVTDGPGAWIRR